MTELTTRDRPGAGGAAGLDDRPRPSLRALLVKGSGREPGQAPGASRPARRALAALRALLPLPAYAAAAVWLFNDAWASPTTAHVRGGSDPGLFVWFLDWTAHAVANGRNPLFSGHLNAPDGVNLMWNTSMILPGVLLAPVTRVWSPVLTYNLLMTASLALSAWTGYLAARRFVRSGVAAAAGGLVYGFSPAILGQTRGHLHMTMLILPPLLLLLVDHALVRQERPAGAVGAALGLLAACQLLIGEEILAFTVIVAALLLVVLVALHPRLVRAKAPYALRALGTAALVAVALAAYPLWVQLAGPQRVVGDIQADTAHSNDLANLVVPTAVQRLRPAAADRVASRFPGTAVEQNGYVGIPMLLLAAAAVAVAARRRTALVAGILASLLAVLSLGRSLHVVGDDTGVALPWAAVDGLPLLQSALPNRLMLLTWLFLGLLLALLVDRALGGGRAGAAAALLGTAGVVATLLPAGPVGADAAAVPPFFTGDGVRRIPEGSTALILPMSGVARSEAMLWQARAGMRFKMPGGYFVGPRGGNDRRPSFGRGSALNNAVKEVAAGGRPPRVGDPVLRARLVADLRRWDVRTVVVGPMPPRAGRPQDRAAVVAFLTDLLRRPPEHVGGVQVWWAVDPVQADPRRSGELPSRAPGGCAHQGHSVDCPSHVHHDSDQAAGPV
jgi:hypothetical protein